MIRTLVLALLLATLQACMLTPTDEMSVCGTNAVVKFEGYTLEPKQTVWLQAATSSSGIFTTFHTTTSAAAPLPLGSPALYYWSAEIMVPTWAYRSFRYETFVRATLVDGTTLVTYDATNARGQTPLQCITEQLDLGKSTTEAGYNCRGVDSPVVRLRAPFASSCPCIASYGGDVVIDSAFAANTFKCLTTVHGNLTVTAEAPASVSLASLTQLDGQLSLDYTTPEGTARAIDLSQLPEVMGGLAIRGTIASGDLPIGLDEVDRVAGPVSFNLENARTDGRPLFVTGLEDLTDVTGPSVHMASLGTFTSALMQGVTHIDYLVIESLGLDPFQGLPLQPFLLRSAGTVEVVYPPGLRPTPAYAGYSLQLLPYIETTEAMTLVNDPFYPSRAPGDLRVYPRLHTIGALSLVGSQLTALDLGAATLDISTFELRDNAWLRTLERPGLSLPAANPVTIVNSPALKHCEAVAFTAGRPGSVLSGLNPTSCTCSASPHTGDLIIDTPLAATNLWCVSSVSGSLIIGDHVRMDRVSLPKLTSIGGDADLLYTRGGVDWKRHSTPRVIDLPALTSVGGDLLMEADFWNPAPLFFGVGMDALTSVGGDIDFSASQGTYLGMSGLVSHAGDVRVHAPPDNASGTLFLPNLANVGGTLRCDGSGNFYDFFKGLSHVGGNLEMQGMNVDGGFDALTWVGGDVVLPPMISDPFPPANPVPFPLLGSVGGSVVWQDYGEPWTPGSPWASYGVALGITNTNGLRVVDNAGLSTLNPGVRVVGNGPIVIQNNPALPTCAANNYVAAQVAGGWTGAATISGNGAGSCP